MKKLRLVLLVGSGLILGCNFFPADLSQWSLFGAGSGTQSVDQVTPDNIDDPNTPAKNSPAATQAPIRIRLSNVTDTAADCNVTMELIGTEVHYSVRRVLAGSKSLVIGPDRADIIRINVTFLDSPPISLEPLILRIGQDFNPGELIELTLKLPSEDEPNVPKPPPPVPPTISIEGLDEDVLATIGDTVEFDLVTTDAPSNAVVAAYADPDTNAGNSNNIAIVTNLPAQPLTTVLWNTSEMEPGTYVIRAVLADDGEDTIAPTPSGRVILQAAEILGACCYPGGSCEIVSEEDCLFGEWLGPNTVCEDCPSCIVSCPPGARNESEPCGEHQNEGCFSIGEPQFEPLICGETVCGTMWLDIFDPNDPNFPFDPNDPFDPNRPISYPFDFDWYEISVSHDAELQVNVEAEFPIFVVMLEQYEPGVPGCENLTGEYAWMGIGFECEPLTFEQCVPAGTYYLWLLPAGYYDSVSCGGRNHYTIHLDCQPCTIIRGACCYGEYGETCAVLSPDDCSAVEGEYQGDGTTCDPNPCMPPLGACCFGVECSLLTASECYTYQGEYQGNGTTCDPNPCLPPQPEGACCFSGGVCEVLPLDICSSLGGEFQGESVPCEPNPCPADGDDCQHPIVIAVDTQLPYSDTNSTCGRGNDYSQTCVAPYDQGEEIIYRLEVSDLGYFSITLDPKGTLFTSMALSTGECPGVECLTALDEAGKGLAYSIGCREYSPGTYYLMIDLGADGGTCIPSFSLSIDPCP